MIALNLIGGLSIFFILIALRLPAFVNSDLLLNADETVMANQIVRLMNGGPLFFYYDITKHFGIFNGLAAIPFFWVLGIGSLAFKLPATLFYALYILSSYWLVKKIQPSAALTVILLLIFSSPAVWRLTLMNWGLGLTCLLGNLVFLSFLEVKETGGSRPVYVFLLGFFVGFAIYSYTYSILYIGSIVILFILSSDYWEVVRNKFSIKKAIAWFVGQKGARQRFVKILDGVILIFMLVILFSYIFGGFGIDIAGYSILQSNELHKPVGQLLIFFILRICLFRHDIKDKLNSLKFLIVSVDPSVRYSTRLCFFGFLVGIFPRILSILTGETTRGGQGFDIDFAFTNLAIHSWELITYFIPEVLGIRGSLVQLFDYEKTSFYFFNSTMVAVIVFLIGKSVISFVAPRWQEVKDIVLLRRLAFNSSQIFVVFPILICAAIVVSQGPPATRYLFPLHGVAAILTAIYLDKVRRKSKKIFAFALVIWCLFSTVGIYQSYEASGYVRGFSVVKTPTPISKLVEFCEAKKLFHAYSDLHTASLTTFLSGGNMQVAEYSKGDASKSTRDRLAREKDFSIIVSGRTSHLETYREYMDENLLGYSQDIVKYGDGMDDLYYIFSNFQGEPATIERLRFLMQTDVRKLVGS